MVEKRGRENRERKSCAHTSLVLLLFTNSSPCHLADVRTCCCRLQAKASRGRKGDGSSGPAKASKWSSDQTLGFEAWLNHTLIGVDELGDDDGDNDGDVDVCSIPFKAMIAMVRSLNT